MNPSIVLLVFPYFQTNKKYSSAYRVEVGYNVMKWAEYFVSLWTSVFITEDL
jgi:hypothetical protein